MRSRTFFLLLIFLAAAPWTGELLFAAPSFDTQFTSEDHIKPGDEILLTINAEWHRAEAEYAFALPEFRLANLKPARQGQSQEIFIRSGTQWIRKTFTIAFQALQSGPASIDAFEINYIDPQNQKGGHYTSAGKNFTIKPESAAWNRPVLWVSGSILFILLLTGTAFLIRRRQRKEDGTETGADMSNQKNPVLEKLGKLGTGYNARTSAATVRVLTECFQEAVLQTTGISPYQTAGETLEDALSKKGLERHQTKPILRLKEKLEEARYGAADLNPQELELICREIREILQKSYSIAV